jgi:hypothetical protein
MPCAYGSIFYMVAWELPTFLPFLVWRRTSFLDFWLSLICFLLPNTELRNAEEKSGLSAALKIVDGRVNPGNNASSSRTPRRAPARIALHACPVPHQRKIPAFAAHFAFVAFGFGAAL